MRMAAAAKKKAPSKASLGDDLEKMFGKNDISQGPTTFLNTGYSPLNFAISSDFDHGLPAGRMVEMFGPPSSGKTAIATKVMASAQQAGGLAAFFDHERSFEIKLARGPGFDLSEERGKWIFKTPDTFEEAIAITMRLASFVREQNKISDKAPIVCCFDSLASMVPMSKFGKDVTAMTMHDNTALARATSSSFPALSQTCEKYNMLALFLNQVRQKPGVSFGDPNTTPGGAAPEFYSSVRIRLGASRITAGEGANSQTIGTKVTATCVKNKISRPFRKATWDFMFQEDGSGHFDITRSLINYLVAEGGLEKDGNKIVWPTDGTTHYLKALIKKVDAEGLQPALEAMVRAI